MDAVTAADPREVERPPEALAKIRQSEPLLKLADIQGNVLPGFNKDFQAFVFLRIVEPGSKLPNARRWLRTIAPFIASAEQVQWFKLAYKRTHDREKVAEAEFRIGKPRTVQATWMNIAFTYEALTRLAPRVDEFTDPAFRAGLVERSHLLGDPREPDREGHPARWVVGGPGNPADVVVIVASDDPDDLQEQLAWLRRTIAPRATSHGPVESGLEIVYVQDAAVLPEPDSKNEHFGFRDGVSQPGLRGRLSTAANDFLTVSEAGPGEAPDLGKGKPGQDLIWPGEIVFGYVRQRGADGQDIHDHSGTTYCPGPDWSKYGSYLVIRRLRQDVRAFRRFFDGTAGKDGLPDSTTLQAKCVGRWPSGAPVVTTGEDPGVPPGTLAPDNPALGADDLRNNDFELADRDPKGEACPFVGHIRRVYTRDDESTSLQNHPDPALREPMTSERTTQTHRLLRRGIPFGPPFADNEDDTTMLEGGGRGLIFVAYQSSIEHQFEFVTRAIVNNPQFRVANKGVDPGYDPGYDPIIGQNNRRADRERTFTLPIDGKPRTITTYDDWVIPTGGGYFFVPSISALTNVIAADGSRGGAPRTNPNDGCQPVPSIPSKVDDDEEGSTMAVTPCVQAAGDAELIEELAKRINAHIKAGTAEAGEHIVEALLEQVDAPRFLSYWELGDFIYHENPYYNGDDVELDLKEEKIRRGGLLRDNNSETPFKITAATPTVPKPPILGGPAGPPHTFYYRVGRGGRELRPGGPLGADTFADDKRFERNIVKEVEIEYGPPIHEEGQDKPPHFIILYGGGDH